MYIRIGQTTGAQRIAAERQRQLDAEGYTPRHDDDHDNGELAMAAVCYAAPEPVFTREDSADWCRFADPWPWQDGDDKRPRDARGVLVEATFTERIRPPREGRRAHRSGDRQATANDGETMSLPPPLYGDTLDAIAATLALCDLTVGCVLAAGHVSPCQTAAKIAATRQPFHASAFAVPPPKIDGRSCYLCSKREATLSVGVVPQCEECYARYGRKE
jgi:hypothetical protein